MRAGFEHDALMYGDLDEFLAGTQGFVEDGIEAGEPVMVAVPNLKLAAIRDSLGGDGERVRFVNMNELGRNPARIIPEVRDWVTAQGDRRCRFIGEPIWPGRTRDETVEATRHEALINLAFAGADVRILCPYDTRLLEPTVVADAERTHPHLIRGQSRCASGCYADPLELWRAREWMLPEPPHGTDAIDVGQGLAAIRAFTTGWARSAGVDEGRIDDLVLAINEAATNALRHGRPPARLRAWAIADQAVFEVTDAGQLVDPLAGRVHPEPTWEAGRGVWLINQLCDLVELRPGAEGTTIRMHMAVG